MAIERVELFSDEYLPVFLNDVTDNSLDPVEDLAVFLLNYRAGFRAQEIAGLEWYRHILNVEGKFRTGKHETVTRSGRKTIIDVPYIQITSDIGKHNNERRLEMHVTLESALQALLEQNGPEGYVIPSRYNVGDDLPKDVLLKRRADALRKRMKRMYEKILGEHAVGHSSHLGRHRFITDLTRKSHEYGITLFDVQRMAGHKDPATTQRYVAPSRGSVSALRGV